MITAGLVDGSQTPGIYRVLDPVSTMSSALSDAGWVSSVVPPAMTTGQFYRGLADAMGWPGYFGANLDALWDALTDLSQPTAVILERWTEFARARPRSLGFHPGGVRRASPDRPAVCRRARLAGCRSCQGVGRGALRRPFDLGW